jgi:UDP-glucose:glycoprotein glucosyltransferase
VPPLPSCLQPSRCLALGTEQRPVLPGYGVEAVLKNMEYSAMDDKAKQAAEKKDAAAAEADAAIGEVKGFMFDRLLERKPHLRQELLTFRDTLMSSDDEETLKVGGWAGGAGIRPQGRGLTAARCLVSIRSRLYCGRM